MIDEHAAEGVLAAAYARARPSLAERMPEHTPVSQAARALRELFERLPETCAEDTDGTVDANTIRLASELVRAAASGTLAAVRAPVPPPPPPESLPRQQERRPAIPLLSGLFERGDREASERERAAARQQVHPPPPGEPTVHTPALLEMLRGAFEAADRLLAASQPPPAERVQVPWAEDRELIDMLHELLVADAEQDPDLALRQLARMKADLALRHDIEALEFDEHNEGCFTYVTNADPADRRILTVRPALRASGRIVRRGEVRGPARSVPSVPEPPAFTHETSDQERPQDG